MEPIAPHVRPLPRKGALRPIVVAVLGNVLAIVAQLPEIVGRPPVNGLMHVPVFGGLVALGLAVATPVAVIVVSLPSGSGGERGVEHGGHARRWTIRVVGVLLSLAVMWSGRITLDVMSALLHVRFFSR